ncbi:MAG: hypothetical protein KDC34_09800 [Saprospiraceae bacterium]|nr:hypothetical protein [Saprospiraceae bacterium]
MSDFKKKQSLLQDVRKKARQSELSLFQTRERLARYERELAALNKRAGNFNALDKKRKAELERLIGQTKEELERLEANLGNVQLDLDVALQAFEVFTDPREAIAQLSDQIPFCLLPIRIETRFKQIEIRDTLMHQLWVRIFPDDIAVDSFEETLSETELANVQKYWGQFAAAAGNETEQRSAWKNLIASHTTGRSAWIKDQYRPDNITEFPTSKGSDELILAIAQSPQIPDSAKAAVSAFWVAIWRANGEKIATETARADLLAALGPEQSQRIEKQYVPVNLASLPPGELDRSEVQVSVIYLAFPDPDTENTKQQDWSRAPETKVMPDRFVLIGYRNGEKVLEQIGNRIPGSLILGPDPSATDADQIQLEDGNLNVPEPLKWMVDFPTAVEKGMGFRVNMNPIEFRSGFDRLLVLGLRLSADETESADLLGELFEHHHYSATEFEILPQGSPTNNTELKSAAFTDTDEAADDSFERYHTDSGLVDLETDPFLKKDGQVLAESLGFEPTKLNRLNHVNHSDQLEAKAMNQAMWPATLGYFMESMLNGVFEESAIQQTRSFFNRFVNGRGGIPAIRVGNQPYGILLTTAFSKLNWFNRRINPNESTGVIAGVSSSDNFFRKLYQILRLIEQDWDKLMDSVSFVGKPGGDPQQVLLDALGLHATSVEQYQRYTQGKRTLYNQFSFIGLVANVIQAMEPATIQRTPAALLQYLGYQGDEKPDILSRFFLHGQNPLTGPFIDDRPNSEVELIRSYTDDDRNYIQWLIDACKTSHNVLRKQEGFTDNKRPAALLYMSLHHALDLAYVDTSLKLHLQANVLDQFAVAQARREPEFLHIEAANAVSESRYSYLYKAQPEITGQADTLIGEFIPAILAFNPAAREFREQLAALEHLKDVPTARLERLFTEHLDLCNYRIDGWKSGILQYQLSQMRQENVDGPAKQGVYLGAFGWLEKVKPEFKKLEPAAISAELEAIFKGDLPLQTDSTNGGFITAPSLNHAVTAAILRNGYISHANSANPDLMAVNLTSERVRKALGVIDGIRNGQTLGELLGYQVERGLHDRHGNLELDIHIYELRDAFPYKKIKDIDKQIVIDGLGMINHINRTGATTYPFGKNLPNIPQSHQDAINQEVDNIRDIHDAISDLAIAESVHQVVQGNYDRASATLNTYSRGGFPPIPDVIQTPRSGKTITQRFGLHLPVGLGAVNPPGATPRLLGEPALNSWLEQVLPDMNQIACEVSYFDHVGNAQLVKTLTMDLLGLQAIDLLYMIDPDLDQAMKSLDDAIVLHIHLIDQPRPDVDISVQYTPRIPGKISVFELAPLIRSLRALALRSRPLVAGDLARTNEASTSDDGAQFIEVGRLNLVRDRLADIRQDINTQLVNVLAPEVDVDDIQVNEASIIAQVDGWAALLMEHLNSLSRFGIQQSSGGSVLAGKRKIFGQILGEVSTLAERWDTQLVDYDALTDTFDNPLDPLTDLDAFAILQKAERMISTTVFDINGQTPMDLRNELDTKRAAYLARLDELQAYQSTGLTTLDALLQAVELSFQISAFELAEPDLSAVRKEILIFAEDIYRLAKSQVESLEKRITKAQDLLDQLGLGASAKEEVRIAKEAAKLLLGEDFKIIPEFAMPEEQLAEIQTAWTNRSNILDHQKTVHQNPFPKDDWLHGVARVRPKMHHWENAVFLAEALEDAVLEVEPIQLPYLANDRWMALAFREEGESFELPDERLLYTAHYHAGHSWSNRSCGLLVDEWTEIIPTETEDTAVAFHYDRPNSEPPQTMLLALPSDFRGFWTWNDLVDTLNETLDQAKKRAIEPDLIDSTTYAHFLPATVSATTFHPITVSLNYALNNQYYTLLNIENDG